MNSLSRLEKIRLYHNKRIFQKLFKIAKVSKLTEEQRKIYESNLKAKRDYMATIEFARKEARIEVFEEWEQKGRLEVRLAIAPKLKEMGMSVDQISKITKLSIAEIEKL